MEAKDSTDPEIHSCRAGDDGDGDGVIRTGTVGTCVVHIITTVIGSGVLSLAWSTAQLGWVGGPVAMLFFAFVTYVSAFLLSDCYRSETGKRNKSYMDAVRLNLGDKQTWACGFLQYLSLYGIGIAYTITTSISIRAILRSNCYHYNGHDAPCTFKVSSYMLIFGAVEVICSLIPDFHNMAWLSTVAAIMSFTYSFIGFALGLAMTIGNGEIKGNVYGAPAPTRTQKVWKVSQALGDIAFSYPYSLLLLEIQDTLKSPPAESKTMKKASVVSIAATTFFYLACGCFGYSAFGNKTPGNILTGFGFYEPFWLVDFANACVILHLVGAYQVLSQPIFAFVEQWVAKRFHTSKFVNKFYDVGIRLSKPYRLNLFRFCFRTLFVSSMTGLAVLFPYFNLVLGLMGLISFWPLAIYFPMQMFIMQKKIDRWSSGWVALEVFTVVCFMTSLFALVGSVEGIASEKTVGSIIQGWAYIQPIYAFVEQWVAKRFPTSKFVNKFYDVGLPFTRPYRLNLFRFCFRTLYVASTTGLAILFPYFNQVLGLLGAINFWPLAIYFPVQLYIVQKKINRRSRKWVALEVFSVVCLMTSLFALVGSMEGIVREKLHS